MANDNNAADTLRTILHNTKVTRRSCECEPRAVNGLNVVQSDMLFCAASQTLERLTKTLNLRASELVETKERAIIRAILEVSSFTGV